MNILQSIILGIIEGLTEFLPVSSTAHLILTSKLIGLAQSNDFVKTFEIAIQLGAILSVVFFYWKDIISKKALYPRVFVAFVPTAVIGLAFYKIIKNVFFESNLLIVAALIIGGIAIIVFENYHKEKKDHDESKGIEALSYRECFLVGLCQSIAIIPGVSRSAATIIGGLAIGIRRRTIVEFSFLLAVPTMLAATVLDLAKTSVNFTANEVVVLLIGFVVSFIVALLSIKFLLNYIRKNNFVGFGVYRIIIGLAFLIKFVR